METKAPFNHNPLGLEIGQKVILDEEQEVKIVGFTTNKLYVKIEDAEGDQWFTMTYRLALKGKE